MSKHFGTNEDIRFEMQHQDSFSFWTFKISIKKKANVNEPPETIFCDWLDDGLIEQLIDSMSNYLFIYLA